MLDVLEDRRRGRRGRGLRESPGEFSHPEQRFNLEVKCASTADLHMILGQLGYTCLDADRLFREIAMPADQKIAVAKR